MRETFSLVKESQKTDTDCIIDEQRRVIGPCFQTIAEQSQISRDAMHFTIHLDQSQTDNLALQLLIKILL